MGQFVDKASTARANVDHDGSFDGAVVPINTEVSVTKQGLAIMIIRIGVAKQQKTNRSRWKMGEIFILHCARCWVNGSVVPPSQFFI